MVHLPRIHILWLITLFLIGISVFPRRCEATFMEMEVERMIRRLEKQDCLGTEEQAILDQFRTIQHAVPYPDGLAKEKLQRLKDMAIEVLEKKRSSDECERVGALIVLSEFLNDEPELGALVKNVCADPSESDAVRIEAIQWLPYTTEKEEEILAFLHTLKPDASPSVAVCITEVEQKLIRSLNWSSSAWRAEQERQQLQIGEQNLNAKIRELEEKQDRTAEEQALLERFRELRRVIFEPQPEVTVPPLFSKERLHQLEQVIAELEAKQEKTEQDLQALRSARDSYATIKAYLEQEAQPSPTPTLPAPQPVMQEHPGATPEAKAQNVPQSAIKRNTFLLGSIGVISLVVLGYILYRMKTISKQ